MLAERRSTIDDRLDRPRSSRGGTHRWVGGWVLDDIAVALRGRALDDAAPARGDGLGSLADRVVLGMDVAHKHRDRLMRGERHPDLHGHPGVRDVGSGPVPDRVRPAMRRARAFQDTAPARPVGVLDIGLEPSKSAGITNLEPW